MNRKHIQDTFDYFLHFTEIYRTNENKYLREARILKLQIPHILQDFQKGDLLAGSIHHTFIGFSPQYGGKYIYFFEEDQARKLLDDNREFLSRIDEIEAAIAYWHTERTLYKLNDRFASKHGHLDPYQKAVHRLGEEGRLGVSSIPDGRLALTIPDLDKLLQLGLHHLYEEAALKDQTDPFIQALLITITTVEDAIDFYKYQLCSLLEKDPDNTELRRIYADLSRIRYQKPNTFLEALQLFWIYAVISDLMNYGRMDIYLGDFYAADLQQGIIDEETAISYLTDLYGKIRRIGKIHDARIILGGLGRRNPQNADQLALLLMETTRRTKEVIPQLTLRCYEGMNQTVFDKALQVNAEGCSFPILYSDDTNIPAIQKAFQVNLDDAMSYIPAGCGEYILEGRSVGTPNSSLNLLKALELALHHGRDMYYQVQAGPDTGAVEDFATFEDLWDAFTAQIDPELTLVAFAEKDCYDIIAENAGCLHLSLLMHDCLEKGKPLLEGGVRYFHGMTEIMGMISAADSLTAIKTLVYDRQIMSLKQLVSILDANFEGYEKERRLMQSCPKYGNDNDEADRMAIRVFNYIAKASLALTDQTGLDKYMMVSVNNSESAVWGNVTMASACGRKNGEALANANGASIGCDRSGATALLNSMRKFDHSLHAGVINNIRFTKELFTDQFDKMKQLIQAFFMNNGSQLNLMVIGKDDLIKAKEHPEKYQNPIVRIGGFSARFVELDPIVQEEIIRRTTFAS